MVHEFDQWVRAFEEGRIDRRALLSKIVLVAGAAVGMNASPTAASEAPKTPTFPANGLNHLALNVTDVAKSRDWYRKHPGLSVIRHGTRTSFLKPGDGVLARHQSRQPGMHP